MENTIVGRIFDTMKDKKITQQQLANELGIGQSTVASWKQRNCPPPINFISQISETLNVSIEYLITGNDNPKRLILTDDEWFIIRHYRYTSEENKAKIHGYVIGLTDADYVENVNHHEGIKTFIPQKRDKK